VDDFYRRFLVSDRPDRHYVTMARVSTILLTICAAVLSLWLENAFQTFQIMLQIGAGTGLIYLLRWFWWRVNAWSEISGMAISFLVAIYFQFIHHPALGLPALDAMTTLVLGVAITTIGWITVTLLTPPTDTERLQVFYDRIRPMGRGWHQVVRTQPTVAGESSVTAMFLCWFLGCVVVYATLFATGSLLYGQLTPGLLYAVTAVVAGGYLFRTLPRVGVVR
jgi:hypothetical protein